ncbi:MAG: hypothetical protein HY923_08835 [Elusimicrobia bacterium]|nr:hypothetical protein [Elusimicrobiota bacterium]
MRFALFLAFLLSPPLPLRAVEVRAVEVNAGRSAWTTYLAAPEAQPLLGAMGFSGLTPLQTSALAGVLVQSGVPLASIQKLPELPAQVHLIQSKASAYAGAMLAAPSAATPLNAPGQEGLVEARLLATLAPLHARAIIEARRQAGDRIDEARADWGLAAAESGSVAGGESAITTRLQRSDPNRRPVETQKAPPAPASRAAANLPFAPARSFSLSHVAAVMERRLAGKEKIAEEQYRSMDAPAFFEGNETRRMDTLLTRQAADQAQAMLEVISNAQDATNTGNKKVGRFGVGGLQILGELKAPEDRVVMETSKGDGTAAQLIFWKKDGEVQFDYRTIPSSVRGTSFEVIKNLGAEEEAHRREFIERKLRANDRGPITWQDGAGVNRPETFAEYGRETGAAPAATPAVVVRLSASGYKITDQGKGMGLKEVFERYLKPYGTDKPVEKNTDGARLFHRAAPAPKASLGVAMVEIERVKVDASRLGLAGDAFIDLPHDTDLSEERGTVSLVPADQKIDGALRGMRLLIDRLTDPSIEDPDRFRLINTVAEVIRAKQPAGDKGVSRGEAKTATDLMWYLRHTLETSRLLDAYRQRGLAFLPNSARWAPLEGVSERIVFLDDALFTPTPKDLETAGLEPLPETLTGAPAWKSFAERTQARFFTRDLRRGGALAVVGNGIIVIDKSIAGGGGDVDVLIARIERELTRARTEMKPAPPKRGLLAWAKRRVLVPFAVAASLAAGVVILNGAFQSAHSGDSEWSYYSQGSYQMSGNPNPNHEAKKHPSKPSRPFGAYSPEAVGSPYFIDAVRSGLADDGAWKSKEAGMTHPDSPVTGSITVGYKLAVAPNQDGKRLFNRANGAITDLKVTDQKGDPVEHSLDPKTDALTVAHFSGVASVSYRIETHAAANGIDFDASALPAIELRDLPAKWRAALDPLKNAPVEERLAAIDKIMAADFAYDYDKPFWHDGSWGKTASKYLDKGERVPIICNTSSLYYYMLSRYMDIPAVYVSLTKGVKGKFYNDVVGHAQTMVEVNGQWRTIETTALMPLVSAAPEVIDMDPGGGDSPSLFNWGFFKNSSPSSMSPKEQLGLLAVVAASFLALLGYLVKGLFGTWKTIRRVKTARAAAALGNFRDRLASWAWWKWEPLTRHWGAEHSASWGAAYHIVKSGWLHVEDRHGRMRAIAITPRSDVRMVADRLLFVPRRWYRDGPLSYFDGERVTPIPGMGFFETKPKLFGRGSSLYAETGSSLYRIDLAAGQARLVAKTGSSSMQALLLDSRGGVDRIAVRTIPAFGKKATFKTLTVSGDKAEWGPEELTARMSNSEKQEFKAYPSGERTVYAVRDKHLLRVFVSGLGEVPLAEGMADPDAKEILWLTNGVFKAAVAGKIFYLRGHLLESFDIASWTRQEPILGGHRIDAIESVGEDVAAVIAYTNRETNRYFVDGDGAFLGPSLGTPEAALRYGDAVFFRDGAAMGRMYVTAKDGQVTAYPMESSPERGYSRAAARATGLDAALFESLDPPGGTALNHALLQTKDPDVLAAAAERDGAALAALDEPLRRAAACRGALGSQDWSLGRMLLSPHVARSAAISAPVLERLDALVRESAGDTARLRTTFELADRMLASHGVNADAALGHLLDIFAVAPELVEDIGRAVLPTALSAEGARYEPIAYLLAGETYRKRLPPLTSLFLQMLAEGPESLLRRESENAPAAAPDFVLEGRGESMSRLIAASRRSTEELLDAGGAAAFARVYEGLADNDRADLSPVTGVVKNQGLSAPVWIRELVQNARDAAREAKRAGRPVPQELALRSYLSEDGSRWIVSVGDKVGMKLSRFLKAMLVPEATTKTLADEVRMFLAMPGTAEEKAGRLLTEFFDDAAAGDAALKAYLLSAVAAPAAQAGKAIAEKLADRMKKGGAGFFGIGFFTVFGGGDQVVVRTGADGMMREGALTPVRDNEGRLIDIKLERIREWADPEGARQGTEVLRVKNVTPENFGRLLVENAYVHIMTGKYAGAVTDVAITLNAAPLHSGIANAAQSGGLRSRLDPSGRARWTADELFVSEPPPEGLTLLPPDIASALVNAGWNLDFPAATPVVRTRTSVQNPGLYAPAAAMLALPTAFSLYRDGKISLPGIPPYEAHWRTSTWDETPASDRLRADAAAIRGGEAGEELWRRYRDEPRLWAQLMLHLSDDKEPALRAALGPKMSADLDAARSRGEPARVGPLPARGSANWEEQVRALHAEALALIEANSPSALAGEPAAAGMTRVLIKLATFLDAPPPFVSAGPALWEGLRRCLDEGKAVPLLEGLLSEIGRAGNADAVRLFEGWLKGQGAAKELETLFLNGTSRADAEASLGRMWKLASRGRPPLLALKPKG